VLLPARMRRAPIAILSVLAVLAAGLVAAAPAQAVSANLVISQVYGGGGNANATYTHDYVELYNRGNAAASIGNLSIQYTSAAGTGNFGSASNLLTELPDITVQPGQYVLVQEATNAAVGAALPPADVTDVTPIAMAAGAGRVALVTGDDTLGCNGASTPCGAAALARIVDLVGYGTGTSGAAFFEGTAPAPTISATLSDFRKVHGCQDTDQNGADFASATPAARNTGTSPVPCVGDAAPSVASTSPADGATDVPVNSNVTVTFSEPVHTGSGAFDLTCENTGAHGYGIGIDATSTTFTIDPSDDFGINELCTLKVVGSEVADNDGDDPPDTMTADRTVIFRTVPPAPSCDDPDTKISEVQGAGASSPKINQVVTVQAVVTAVRPGLTGFFIQEEAGDIDGSDATSEGVFVRTTTPPAGLAAGDVVQVTGGVREFTGSGGGMTSSQTQISDRVSVLTCAHGADLPPEGVLELPVTSFTDFEHFEGMRVTMPQALVISEYFNYGRFNETVVGMPPNGRSRFDSPSAVQEPNTAATTALLADYAKRRITLDDGRSVQNPSPPYFPGTVDTPFTLTNAFRGGDTVTGVTGVMEHTFGLYRIHPTSDASYTPVNPRPAAPPVVGGDTKIAAFNVLNYFLTPDAIQDDTGANNPADDVCGGNANLECRGADGDQPQELQRQRTKIIKAISTVSPDVVGLMEMENTPNVEPAADLAAGLNDATAPGTYSYIDTGVIGTDAIRVGLLYKPAKMTPVGAFKVLDSSVDPRFIDSRNRPALAQTFQRAGSGERITVAVNHLKSKGSACAGDPDLGDGAGNCNITRREAAKALVDWLASDPTNSGDPDRVIIGDLNSYDHEDPIDELVAGGYTDLIKKYGGEYAYSYVFDGQVGYLDHGLASSTLLRQVRGAGDWHINSDEPTLVDYDTSFKNPSEEALYEPNQFRASDHDPVVLGMELGVRQCEFSDNAATSTRTLLSDCDTSQTILVPNGWTLDGAGHSITAKDPADGHFLGAVVRNAGASANVRDLTVTASSLNDVCDDGDNRLRGILLDGASGSILNNHVLGINQGASGCQEGNGIEVRNAPFDTTGLDKTVLVSGNEVRDYQKGGIVANGSVKVTVLNNTVDGVGPVDYIAQNGIQVAFGGTGVVESNTVTDNFYTGADLGCGLLFLDADGVKQKKNTFSGNEKDICNFGRGGGSSPGKT
jgi:predicted extracellular nuclease